MEVRIEGNKIFAPLKNKWLVYKPEEEVRQRYICRLIDSYGFSPEQMDQEIQVNNSKRGQGGSRADIIVWKSKEDKLADPQKSPIIIVECKAESVTIHEEDYYQGYNYASWAGAYFFATTNLKETRIFKVIKGEMPKRLEEIVDIPNAEKANDQKELDKLLNQTKAFTRDEFSRLLLKCHNIIRNNDKLSPEAAFDEISKILFPFFVKWQDKQGACSGISNIKNTLPFIIVFFKHFIFAEFTKAELCIAVIIMEKVSWLNLVIFSFNAAGTYYHRKFQTF